MMGVISGLEMAPGEIVAGRAVEKPIHALLGWARPRSGPAQATPIFIRAADEGHAYTDAAVYRDHDCRAARAARVKSRRVSPAVKFDPAGPYSTFDPRQPASKQPGAERALCTPHSARPSERAATLLLGTRRVNSRNRASVSPRGSSPNDPLWFEEPDAARRIAGGRWRGVRGRRRCRSRRRSASPQNTSSRRVMELGAASICSRRGPVGGLSGEERSAGMAEATTRSSPQPLCGR